jgi:cyclase
MLKKRIIPCLDIQDGRTVKGVHFVDIRDAGDPVELAQLYADQGADELVFLDITATVERRKTLVELVGRIARHIHIPFTVGGGIRTVEEAKAVVEAGADKVSVNSSAVARPELIGELSAELGSQAVVVAIDTRFDGTESIVYVHGGRTPTELRTVEWARQAEALGAGEILLTSMNHDGAKTGFALDITSQVCNAVTIPVIASGGAGKPEHFEAVFRKTSASAALAASIFHFGEVPIPELKQFLRTRNIPIR